MTVLAAPADVQGSSGEIGGLAGLVLDVVQLLGPVGVGLLIFLENLFPPIPSEVVLPLAGFLVGRGELGFVPVAVGATTGSVLGALALYGLGGWLGRDRFRRAFGKLPLVEVRDLDRAEQWFERYGEWAVLLGRLMPVVRSLISVPAGAARMPMWRFLLFTTVGSAVWNTIFIALGAWAGDRWHDVGQYSDLLSYGVVAAIAGAVMWFIVKRLRRRRELVRT